MAKAVAKTEQVDPDTGEVTDLVVAGSTGMFSADPGTTEVDIHRGKSQSAEDNLIPSVKLLQAQHHEVIDGHPAYIPGAVPGDFLIPGADVELVKGNEGFLFQPAAFWTSWNEYGMPRVMNDPEYLGSHKDLPDDAVEEPDEDDPRKMNWVRTVKVGKDNKKSCFIFTRNHAGFVLFRGQTLPMPVVLRLQSTGNTASRDLMQRLNSHPRPAYEQVYHVTSGFRSNRKGNWKGWNFSFFAYLSEKDPTAKKQIGAGNRLLTDYENQDLNFADPVE